MRAGSGMGRKGWARREGAGGECWDGMGRKGMGQKGKECTIVHKKHTGG
jgi:hypothetical protein